MGYTAGTKKGRLFEARPDPADKQQQERLNMEKSNRRVSALLRPRGGKLCAIALAGLIPAAALAAFPPNFPLSSIDGTNGVRIDAAIPGDMLGWSVSKAGDFNGDGFADFMVGAPNSAGQPGAAYVIYGGAGGLASPLIPDALVANGRAVRIDGAVPNGQLGAAVAAAGDVNHDGYADIIIGAAGESAAYVVFGRGEGGLGGSINVMALDGINGFRIVGSPNEQFGASVAAAGDVNGDGIADVVVGNGASNLGPGCVIFGRTGPFPPNLTCSGLSASDGFMLVAPNAAASSYAVAGVGDVNGDGLGDLLIGAPDQSTAYLVYGQPAFPPAFDVASMAQVRLTGPVGSWFGNSVAGISDFNGDGIPDIAIGAPLASPSPALNQAGMGYVVYGKGSGDPWPPVVDVAMLDGTNGGFQIHDLVLGDRAGWSVGAAGDINLDGLADLIIGAPYSSGYGRGAGASYVIYGRGFTTSPILLTVNSAYPNYLDGNNGFQLTGAGAGDLSGSSVSGVGDFNGDGLDDFIIGARNAAMGAGAAFVVYNVDSTPPVVSMTPSAWPNEYGWNNSPISFSVYASDGNGSGVQETRVALDPATVPMSFDELPATWVDPVFTTEGIHHVYGASMDRAGNKEGPVGYVAQIDMTAPRVKVTGVTRGATYTLGNVPTAGCRTTDALSGVLTKATATITGGRPNGTGTFTVTCAGALDRAGNSGSAMLRYRVVK